MRLPVEIDLAAEKASIPGARLVVAEALYDEQLDADVVADLLIVVSELVTNAVVHGVGTAVQLAVRDAGDCIEITVVSRCRADVDPVPGWTMPPPEAIGGRGLALVRALADQVVATTDAGSLAVTAARRR